MKHHYYRRVLWLPAILALLFAGSWSEAFAETEPPLSTGNPASSEGLEVEVTKKGLGKEVSIRKGAKEWFMLVEVTPENTVVIRQEKDHDNYLVDESETHDRALTNSEVDAVIEDFINSVKTQSNPKRK